MRPLISSDPTFFFFLPLANFASLDSNVFHSFISFIAARKCRNQFGLPQCNLMRLQMGVNRTPIRVFFSLSLANHVLQFVEEFTHFCLSRKQTRVMSRWWQIHRLHLRFNALVSPKILKEKRGKTNLSECVRQRLFDFCQFVSAIWIHRVLDPVPAASGWRRSQNPGFTTDAMGLLCLCKRNHLRF